MSKSLLPLPLTMFWQPVADLMTGEVIGYEALGRLTGHESDGFAGLERLARARRCRQATLESLQALALREMPTKPPGSFLFLNVTHRLLRPLTLALGRLDGSLHDLVLELPEADARFSMWEGALMSLRHRGVQIAVDDWGSGLSDPLRLVRLHPEWIKIDVSLTQQLGSNADADRLIQLLVRWVDPARTRIVAEGVENPGQVLHLRQLGIRYGQGFALARPSPDWPRRVTVPDVGTRLKTLDAAGLTLIQFYPLEDEALERMADARDILDPLVDRISGEVSQWIVERAVSSPLLLHSSAARFQAVLSDHLRHLFRGELGREDVDRAARIVDAHLRFGVDFSWYLMAHRELEAHFARSLRAGGHSVLAEAVREVLSWDAGLVAHLFQRAVERDMLTGVLTRRSFWLKAEAALDLAWRHNQGGALTVLDIRGLKRYNGRYGHPGGDQILTQVGQVLVDAMADGWIIGRVGGDRFGLFISGNHPPAVRQSVQHLFTDIRRHVHGVTLAHAIAWTGVDGANLAALYAAADERLAHNTERAPAARPGP